MNNSFNPNGYGIKNGHFIGLPYSEKDAKVVLLPVPWEATVSYAAGTALGPNNILEASYQLDLVDWDQPKAWETPIYMYPPNADILENSNHCRTLAQAHIDTLEHQLPVDEVRLASINATAQAVHEWVYWQSKALLAEGKRVGLVGGEHSIPFGYLRALAEKYPNFGILQIDAHCDLRQAYEGFLHSHASIFYNVLEQIPAVQKLVQVGIRDVCQAELDYAEEQGERVAIYSMQAIRQQLFEGQATFQQICQAIVAQLPQQVYISFDIDGLDPKLCPNTGTPVPGGLEIEEAFYLLQQIKASGRQIIGFDLCEVGSAAEWDGNVGARVLYKLAVLLGNSH